MPDPPLRAHRPTYGPSLRLPATAFGKPVCRLGLASRGGPAPAVSDVHHAVGLGADFLNRPGTLDAFGRAIAELGSGRERAV